MRSRTCAAAFAAAIISPTLVVTTAPHAAAADTAAPAAAKLKSPPRIATSIGRGGAISTVDPNATAIGLRVLRHGGNAVDAAVSAAAAFGVTEPYSSGIGGGGYFVHYSARTHKVATIDGRETAPRRMRHDSFIDPATGQPYNFNPERVSSGVAVGVPGTLKTWQRALRRWGTRSLARSLAPAARLARRGFVVDQTFHDQTADNQARFGQFKSTRRLFLKGGQPPAVGSRFRNRDLARTYDLIARKGVDALYRGRLAHQIAHTVQHPPKVAGATLPAMPGRMTARDLRRYRTIDRRPTKIRYRGLDIYGMAPSSSGGSTVGEMLNILERYNLHGMDAGKLYHHYIEASALAFADRNAYVGDPRSVTVPLRQLLSDTFAAERACSINEQTAAPKPVPAGNVASYDGKCAAAPAVRGSARPDTENVETTNLTVVDRRGDVVEYTLTIEQTGGSGIVVPGRGFLLNNELTDFSAAYDPSDPNRIEPGKRPRSSISPTIVLKKRRPWLALGSPGGATIINTVSQLLVDRIDRGMSIARAIAEPRLANANTTASSAEPAFVAKYAAALAPYGQTLKQLTGATSAQEIGAATAIEIGRHGRLVAVAEPTRRGGGSARVVRRAGR